MGRVSTTKATPKAKKGAGRPAGKAKPWAKVESNRPQRSRVNVLDIQYVDQPNLQWKRSGKTTKTTRKPKGSGKPKKATGTNVEGRKMIGKMLHYKVGGKWVKVYDCNMKDVKKWEKSHGDGDADAGEPDSGDEYEVDKIVNEKMFYKKPVYLVRWKGFKSDSDTWEPAEQLKSSLKILAAWEETKQAREQKKIEKTIKTNERRAERKAAQEKERKNNPPKPRGNPAWGKAKA